MRIYGLLMCGALVGSVLALGCSDAEPGASGATETTAPPSPPGEASPKDDPEVTRALAELRVLERQTRAATDFAELAPGQVTSGPDPMRVEALPDGRTLALLRGQDALVLLAPNGTELTRVTTPPSPRALFLTAAQQGPGRNAGTAMSSRTSAQTPSPTEVWVGGGLGGALWRWQLQSDELVLLEKEQPAGVKALADIVVTPSGVRYGLDSAAQQLVRWRAGEQPQRITPCRGPRRLRLHGNWLLASCLYDHRLLIRQLDDAGELTATATSIEHDGPIWSWAARRSGDGLALALGGIENHALDRSEGFFGHIDSMLFMIDVSAAGGARRQRTLNLSQLGVVTPKALLWLDDARLLVTGYGAERGVIVQQRESAEPRTSPFPAPPGITDMSLAADGTVVAANPLLDSIQRLHPAYQSTTITTINPLGSDSQTPIDEQQRWLGEVLAFTTLMAPHNPTRGAHSSFSCEACHFEGHIDGRVHHTGRGRVHAATKPLRGLFNNKPHFTRALDPDLTRVCHAEFRVAGKGSGHSPWFALESRDHPWMHARLAPATLTPAMLRKALLRYLMTATHPSHPLTWGKTALSAREDRGMKLFAQHCSSCHAARLITDDSTTEVPAARWPELILSPQGPIVWASPEYRKTGVLPYVHEQGARTTSLRRVHSKWPYFTNGTARSLEQLIAQLGWLDDRFQHQSNDPAIRHLEPADQDALLAFVSLL